MRVPTFAAADAAFAALLLLVLVLLALRALVPAQEGSGFVVPVMIDAHARGAREVSPPAKEGRVNPNQADAERLASVPGMGPALAQAVVRFRQSHGPFRHLSDLERVPEIGAKRLQRILPYLTLEEEGTWSTR